MVLLPVVVLITDSMAVVESVVEVLITTVEAVLPIATVLIHACPYVSSGSSNTNCSTGGEGGDEWRLMVGGS